jgi:orotate phosphoribosyltransferase/orotidine-5'-phosphate decarboxylase
VADTSDTNVNTIKHYAGLVDILTVRDSVSAKGFKALRDAVPGTKIALVSMLTDTPPEECQVRNGKDPTLKIMTDIVNIRASYKMIRAETDPEEPFDMVVCSPKEVNFLFRNFGHLFQFIVPGIRDEWMTAGQQSRFTGVREALNSGATYVVAGAQMTKGNPKAAVPVSAEESRQRTFAEIGKSNYVAINPRDPLATLLACDGFYESPKDEAGISYVGPLVAYAGTYKAEGGETKNKVGFCYFNVAKAEERPLVRQVFARLLADKISKSGIKPTLLIGMPMGGIVFAAALSDALGVRLAFAEKKVKKLAEPGSGQKEESEMIISRHEINPGDVVMIVEDTCNNFSTTDKAQALVESKGGIFSGIACVVNRAEVGEFAGKQVVSLIHKPSPQYRQDSPEVADLIRDGKVIWKPKHEWPRALAAMAGK